MYQPSTPPLSLMLKRIKEKENKQNLKTPKQPPPTKKIQHNKNKTPRKVFCDISIKLPQYQGVLLYLKEQLGSISPYSAGTLAECGIAGCQNKTCFVFVLL